MEAQEKEGINWLSFILWSIVTQVTFYTLATIPIWLLESHQILNLESIRLELYAFILVMMVGDIANSSSADLKTELDSAGWAKVSLFVILAVFPEYFQHVFEGRKSAHLFSCVFNSIANGPKEDSGLLVSALLLIGTVCAVFTAFSLRAFEDKNKSSKRDYSDLSALASFIVATVMLSVYLFMKHLNTEEVADCSSLNHSRAFLSMSMLILLLIIWGTMYVTRRYSVYVFIPFILESSTGEPYSARCVYNQLLLLMAFIIISAIAFYYRDSLSENPILLILFGLLVCFVILKLLSAVIHWKNYYPHIALVLIATICALAVTYLAMAYFHNRSNEGLKNMPLSPENIEYLDQFKTN